MKKKFSFTRKHLAIPYAVFLVVFVIIPLFIVVYYAFSATSGGFTFKNFAEAWKMNAFGVLWTSLLFSFLTTLICFFLGYPIAFVLSNPKFNRSYVTVLLFVVPMWINFMLRTYALNTVFDVFGIKRGYVPALIGTVYDFLPFMILPIYTILSNIDKSFAEASLDLGATPLKTFLKVTFPLSVPGIVSGAIMVFMPTVSSFAIAKILGRDLMLFGTLINMTFGQEETRGVSSAMSLVMLALVGLSVFLASRLAKKQGGVAGAKGGAW